MKLRLFLFSAAVASLVRLVTAAMEPQPTVMVQRGRVAETEEPPLTTSAVARTRAKGHIYIEAAVPGGWAPNRWQNTNLKLSVQGPQHGVAAVDGTRLYVRLVGKKAPKRVTVVAHVGGQTWQRGSVTGWTRKTVHVDVPRKVAAPKELPARFFRAWSQYIRARGDAWWGRRTPFHSFAASRASVMAGRSATGTAVNRRERRSDLGEMMSLYTGATSVEEALQADRGLRYREEDASKRTVAIDSIEAVPLKPHPWEEMIRELGKPVKSEPLAARVPDDMLYLHFHDLRTAVKAAADVDQWLTPLARLVEWRSGDSFLAERYERQLMIERTGLSKTLGHIAAKGVAVTCGDPFLREGADVSILFHVRNKTLLNSSLSGYEASARSRHPKMKEATYTVHGHSVRNVFTADRTVNQHRMDLDGVIYVSNSRRAIERFADVYDGRAPALQKSGDYRYMRAVYPYDRAEEDGYVFISDAFVARAISPRTKILQARRMAAQADMAAVGYASLMYGWLEGRAPKNIDAVVEAGYLSRDELKHADGTPIAFDAATGASSKVWGRTSVLTPLADLDIAKATPAEKAAYDQFRTGYQRYWRTFIDPIAVRIRRSSDGKRFEVDGRMLPLIERSDYDELIGMVGRGLIVPPVLMNGAQWTLAIGEKSRLRRELDKMGRFLGSTRIKFGWLGDWVMVGTGDGPALWDLAVLTDMVPRAKRHWKSPRDAEVAGILNHAPLYVGAEVRNPISLVATLTAIRAFAESAAPGMVEWKEGARHRNVKTVKIEVTLRGRNAPPDPFAIHYAIADSAIIVALNEATLLQQVDRILDGHAPRPPARDGTDDEVAVQTHLGFAADRPDSWLIKVAQAMIETEALRQRSAAFRDMEVLVNGLRKGLPTRESTLAYLGFHPATVQGGQFELTDGALTHTLYGTETTPIVPAVPVEGAPLTRLLETLSTVGAGIEFEGEGKTRGLHIRLGWSRR